MLVEPFFLIWSPSCTSGTSESVLVNNTFVCKLIAAGELRTELRALRLLELEIPIPVTGGFLCSDLPVVQANVFHPLPVLQPHPPGNASAKTTIHELTECLIMVFHTVLLLAKELTSQPEKHKSGPTIMDSIGITMSHNILKQLARWNDGLWKTQLQGQLGGSSMEVWGRIASPELVYALNHHPGALAHAGSAAPPPGNRRLGRRVMSRRFSQTNGFRGERWAPPHSAELLVRLSVGYESGLPPPPSGCAARARPRPGKAQFSVVVTCLLEGEISLVRDEDSTWPSISDRLICEAEFSEGLFYLVLAKFGSPFICVLLVHFGQHTVSSR
ncbi:hypothetical protein STEG23_015692, partial [Scotinomys teguina]